VLSPRDQAKALKGNLEWNPKFQHKAQQCFQVLSDCNICLVWPDLFERDLLKNEEGYVTESNGILTPCPYCGINKHVEQNGLTIYDRKLCSAMNTNVRRMFIVGPKYACHNPECVGTGNGSKSVKNREQQT
jgi:hypothetical protein